MTLPGPLGTPSRLTAAALAAVAVLAVALLGGGLAQYGTGELGTPAAGTTTLLRLLLLTGLAVPVGEITGRRFAGEGARPRALAVPAALLAAAASAGILLLFVAVSGLSASVVYGLREGRLLLVTANACVLAALCASSRRPGLAALPLAVAIGAEALRAHPEGAPFLGTCLTLVHLTAACLWTGTLFYVLRVMRLRGGGREVLARYARMAAWVYTALAVTGTVSTLRKLPLDAVLSTAYGRVLLVKLALFGGASLLALAARSRMTSGGDAQGPARVEVSVLVAILVVSALLTVVPDPHGIAP
ncbi:copper resistance D family protein [Streptomyces sp. NPDC101490]|uniref:copper resistance D family protein n=1 Tax=Streptomyces sp. NPDC101490 TaxID=3366143 RepID=UPI00382A9297